jgi:hypothetical protein
MEGDVDETIGQGASPALHGKSDNAPPDHGLRRRDILLGGTAMAAAFAISSTVPIRTAQARQWVAPQPAGRRSNILVIMGDDIGRTMA